MAELDVQIDGRGAERGANVVVRSFNRIKRSSETSERAVRRQGRTFERVRRASLGFGSALSALAAGFAVRQVIAYTDAYTQLQNRLRLVTDGSEELAAVTDEVFAAAQRNRSGVEATAELYARIARSSEQLGISQQRVLDVTDSVSKAITISGVSADAANAAIVQLGQGLAAGALRGDELRSVLEQTPRLARAIADDLDVPIGKLRELGAEGELTAEKVIGALEDQAGVLQEEFGQTTATVGQALTQLNNSVIKFVGNLDGATGASAGLARTIQSLSGFIDENGDSFRSAAFEATQFFRQLTLQLTTVETRYRQFQNAVAGTLATIVGNDAVVEQAIQDRLRLEQELDAQLNEIDDYLNTQRELFEESNRQREAADDVDLTIEPEAIESIDSTGESVTRLAEAYDELQKVIVDDPGFLEAYNDQLERGRSIMESIRLPAEIYRDTVLELNELLGVGALSQREYNRALVAAQDELVSAVAENDQFNSFLEQASIQAARNIQSAFADFLFDPFDQGLDGLLSSFADTLREMAAEALSAEVFKILKNQFASLGGGGGLLGGFGGFFSSIFGGAFADGGDFSAGRPILVGEEGPEIIRPRQSGTVVPNDEIGGSSGPVQVENPLNITNVVDPGMAVAAIESAQGQNAIINVIQSNPDIIRRALN